MTRAETVKADAYAMGVALPTSTSGRRKLRFLVGSRTPASRVIFSRPSTSSRHGHMGVRDAAADGLSRV